jgi:hypothetical protein
MFTIHQPIGEQRGDWIARSSSTKGDAQMRAHESRRASVGRSIVAAVAAAAAVAALAAAAFARDGVTNGDTTRHQGTCSTPWSHRERPLKP